MELERKQWNLMPAELEVMVFKKLDFKSLLSTNQVCKKWRDNFLAVQIKELFIEFSFEKKENIIDYSKFSAAKFRNRRSKLLLKLISEVNKKV